MKGHSWLLARSGHDKKKLQRGEGGGLAGALAGKAEMVSGTAPRSWQVSMACFPLQLTCHSVAAMPRRAAEAMLVVRGSIPSGSPWTFFVFFSFPPCALPGMQS